MFILNLRFHAIPVKRRIGNAHRKLSTKQRNWTMTRVNHNFTRCDFFHSCSISPESRGRVEGSIVIPHKALSSACKKKPFTTDPLALKYLVQNKYGLVSVYRTSRGKKSWVDGLKGLNSAFNCSNLSQKLLITYCYMQE